MLTKIRAAILTKYEIIQYTMMTFILYMSFLRATTIIKPNVAFIGEVKVDITLLYWFTVIVAILYLLVALMRFLKIGFNISKDEALILFFSLSLILYAVFRGSKSSMEYIQAVGFFSMYFLVTTALKTLSWNQKTVANVLKIFFSISVIYILFSVYVILTNYNKIVALPTGPRAWFISGISYNPNDFANQMLLGIMAIGSLAIYYIYHQQHKVMAMLLFMVIPVWTVFIFLGNSRGALFGLFIYLLILFIYVIKNKIVTFSDIKNHKRTSTIVTLVSAAFLVFLVITGLFGGFFDKFNQGTSHRWEMWVSFFSDNWNNFPSLRFFTGDGYIHFHDTLASYVKFENPANVPHLHNFLLEIWGRYGFVNMGLLLYIIFTNIKRGFKSKDLWFLSFIPFGFMARDMFEANLFISTFRWEMIFFWFALIAPTYYEKYAVKESVEDEV